MTTNIRVLKKSDDRDSFSCGELELDYYFKRFAGQNQFKHFIGVTYIATDDENIFGFVTISAGSLMHNELPREIQKKSPRYSIPILHISRMGVDTKHQKQGLGRELISTSFKLALEQKERFGCAGVVVDAKSDAVEFYKKLGFIALEVKRGLLKNRPAPIPMFIAIGTIQKAL